MRLIFLILRLNFQLCLILRPFLSVFAAVRRPKRDICGRRHEWQTDVLRLNPGRLCLFRWVPIFLLFQIMRWPRRINCRFVQRMDLGLFLYAIMCSRLQKRVRTAIVRVGLMPQWRRIKLPRLFPRSSWWRVWWPIRFLRPVERSKIPIRGHCVPKIHVLWPIFPTFVAVRSIYFARCDIRYNLRELFPITRCIQGCFLFRIYPMNCGALSGSAVYGLQIGREFPPIRHRFVSAFLSIQEYRLPMRVICRLMLMYGAILMRRQILCRFRPIYFSVWWEWCRILRLHLRCRNRDAPGPCRNARPAPVPGRPTECFCPPLFRRLKCLIPHRIPGSVFLLKLY